MVTFDMLCCGVRRIFFWGSPTPLPPTSTEPKPADGPIPTPAAEPFGVGHFILTPFGVLGTRLTAQGQMATAAPPPHADKCAFVDPAGLHYIQQFGPSGAGGAAGAVYKFLGISRDAAFPPDVVASVVAVGTAKAHAYALPDGSDAICIHVVGPDFRSYEVDYESAVKDLSVAYSSVLTEFATACEQPTLRLLPISGGIFGGPFRSVAPKLAYDAISLACAELQGSTATTLASKRIEMCIFMEAEWQGFVDAGFKG